MQISPSAFLPSTGLDSEDGATWFNGPALSGLAPGQLGGRFDEGLRLLRGRISPAAAGRTERIGPETPIRAEERSASSARGGLAERGGTGQPETPVLVRTDGPDQTEGRSSPLARYLRRFQIDAEMTQKEIDIELSGKGFDRERKDPGPQNSVERALQAYEASAMRSAGLSLVSSLVSSVISGARRLTQGS